MKILIVVLFILSNIIAVGHIKDDEIEKLRSDFYKAVSTKGNEDMAEKMLEKLTALLEKKYTPTRASYLGSITAKMATYSMFPWTKMSYSEDGSKLLNKAIKQEPNNLSVRLNRINSFINFPDFLKKGHFIQEDARWLIKTLKSKDIKNINEDGKQNIYKVLSMFFAKEKDTKRYNQYVSKLTNKSFKEDVKKFKENI